MDLPESTLFKELIIIVILVSINAFFAAAEIAFVSINKPKIEQLADEGNRKAIRVLKLLENPSDFLAITQIAITLAGFLSSAQAATSFALVIESKLPDFPGIDTLIRLGVTLILSYFTLVFGELFPKQVALQMPEKIAMGTSGIVNNVRKFFKPFVWLLTFTTNFLQKITPIDFTETEDKLTREEMLVILDQSRKSDSFDVDELEMMEGVLSLDTKLAREVMVPRTDTFMVDIEDSYINNLRSIIDSPFSRIPLYEGEKDNVIGILHMKTLLKAASTEGFENLDILELSNDPMFVPSTIYIDDLLIEFQRKQQHMAVLIDEYGGVEGIVTMEDLLEEIVGEIDDETDIITPGDIRVIDDLNYYLSGSLPIDDFNDYFDEKIEEDAVDTIAGFMIHQIGYVPKDNEQLSVRINDYVLTTSEIKNGRIYGVLLKIDTDRVMDVNYYAPNGMKKSEKNINEKLDSKEDSINN